LPISIAPRSGRSFGSSPAAEIDGRSMLVWRPVMTGVGKVDKKVLKASFWAGRERMVG
jgi:hypothetical protein